MSLGGEITPPLGARHRDSGESSMVWGALFQTPEKNCSRLFTTSPLYKFTKQYMIYCIVSLGSTGREVKQWNVSSNLLKCLTHD